MKKSFIIALGSAVLLLNSPAHAEIKPEARSSGKIADKKTDKAIIFQNQGEEIEAKEVTASSNSAPAAKKTDKAIIFQNQGKNANTK